MRGGCTYRYGRAARDDASVRRRGRRAQGRPRPHAPGQRRVLQLPGQPRAVVNRDAVLVFQEGSWPPAAVTVMAHAWRAPVGGGIAWY